MRVEFFRHSLQEADIRAATDVLRSVFLTTGPVCGDLEKRFAEYTGLPHVVSLNSCTAALHLALLAMGIGPGDEVITTPMTFIATATAILHTGAVPVFADVEGDTALMDAAKVEAVITARTKAILPVHLYGAMVDMAALRRLADRHGLKIIEDCAHCLEGVRDGIRPGQLGDAACYSFYATKNLTCGEGGALAARDGELAARVRLLRQHGMSKEAADRYTGRYQHWDMLEAGWKYNLDDIHAALMIHQIDRLESQLARRREICDRYTRAFASMPVDVPRVPAPADGDRGACHLYTLWVDPARRDEILHALQQREVGVAVNYRAIHTLTFFRERFGYEPCSFPAADLIGRRTISLPLYPKLTDQEVQYVIDSVAQAVGAPATRGHAG